METTYEDNDELSGSQFPINIFVLRSNGPSRAWNTVNLADAINLYEESVPKHFATETQIEPILFSASPH